MNEMNDQARAAADAIRDIAELALKVDVDALKGMRTDLERLVKAGGWIGETSKIAAMSYDAFMEYREKIDAIVETLMPTVADV